MNKTACITGASEGLGREFAMQLARQGYNTINIARNESRLKELVSELQEQYGGEHDYHVADLSGEAGINSCMLMIEKNDIDVLVNNAGFSQFGSFKESTLTAQEGMLFVNVMAVLKLSHAFLGKSKKGDSLINVSSLAHYATTPIQPVYCATKCFVASLSESLWFQERSRGVYVQALLPGITKTQFIEHSGGLDGNQQQLLDIMSMTPQAVVKSSLNAMNKKRGPMVIPGMSNKLITILVRLLPTRLSVFLLGKLGQWVE